MNLEGSADCQPHKAPFVYRNGSPVANSENISRHLDALPNMLRFGSPACTELGPHDLETLACSS